MSNSPRQKKRFDLRMPVLVSGADVYGDRFAEPTTTVNVSGGGTCFDSAHQLAVGARIDLSIQLPIAIRRYFDGRSIFDVRAVVCRVEETPGGQRVGARFLRAL